VSPSAAPRGGGIGALLTLAALALAWGCNWSFMKLVFAEFPIWGFRAVSGLVAKSGSCVTSNGLLHMPSADGYRV